MLSGGLNGSGELLVIDLNCDMGEGMTTDESLYPFISSANIACGYHAGDPDTMRRTVELSLRHRVAIGAHPSYPDRANFGRVDLLGKTVELEEVSGMIVDQLIGLQAICDEFGVRMHHVKPHGALYNRAAADLVVSQLICRAIREFDPSLLLYGLSGSQLQVAAVQCGLRFVSEVFADRGYRADGSLVPRTEPGALIGDTGESVQQVLTMVEKGVVLVREGMVGGEGAETGGAVAREGVMMRETRAVALMAETVCLHGDGAHAVGFAEAIHGALQRRGVTVRAPMR